MSYLPNSFADNLYKTINKQKKEVKDASDIYERAQILKQLSLDNDNYLNNYDATAAPRINNGVCGVYAEKTKAENKEIFFKQVKEFNKWIRGEQYKLSKEL